MRQSRSIWITWEEHRRSRELADAFGADYMPLIWNGPYFARVLVLAARTTLHLIRLRPSILFVQNPSQVLAALACLLSPVLGFTLIVDRHSNFKLATLGDPSLKMKAFHLLSRWSVRRAHQTIVTIEHLRRLVEEWGGRGMVLPDRLPSLSVRSAERANPDDPRFKVVFVAGYGDDEPLDAVLEAAAILTNEARFFITGNYRHHGIEIGSAPDNVCFTGFIDEGDYVALLAGSDLVMALTMQEHVLNCAAYEAIALGTPLLLSDTDTLRTYFRHGVLFTSNTATDISKQIRTVRSGYSVLRREIAELKGLLMDEWHTQFDAVEKVIVHQTRKKGRKALSTTDSKES